MCVFCVLFSKGSNLNVLHSQVPLNNVDLNAYNRQWKSLVICYGLYLKAIIILWLGPFFDNVGPYDRYTRSYNSYISRAT